MVFQCIDQAVVTDSARSPGCSRLLLPAECMREPSERASCIYRDAIPNLYLARAGSSGGQSGFWEQ
jgi:hypothetical protein